MTEAEVVETAFTAGGAVGVLVALGVIARQLPAVLGALHAWHLDVKRMNLLRHQFDQTRSTESNRYLYPPSELCGPDESQPAASVRETDGAP